MVSLATFIAATALGAVLGVVGVVATVGAVSPSADHVAEQSKIDPTSTIYGAR
ncbi:hypothetical protein ACIBSW_02680 [Actinoplanes sp. NPDC049668]|uniref:hypothetical protein n=1 Tax=unclassified Actinoplanes TaxID=2626549 RepID=UPI0033B9F948